MTCNLVGLVLLLSMGCLASAAQSSFDDNKNVSYGLQQAVAGDLQMKMLTVDDGTPRGKCYCSCSLNNQPVFMEIDPSDMPGSFAVI